MSDTVFAPDDPLETLPAPERVNYATGVLLDAEDFRAEQTYHRGRQAALLRALAGFGTLAGLRVRPPAAGDAELELRVDPGLAIDPFGRLVELRAAHCIRLARWFATQPAALLTNALHRAPDMAVVVDVFVTARAQGRAATPAFATGPFDALDAVVPARLADAGELSLVPRAEAGDPPLPRNFWPDAAASAETRLQAILGSWDAPEDSATGAALPPLPEQVEGQNPAAIFLARACIPASLAPGAPAGTPPTLDLTRRVSVDNRARPFVHLPGKWLGRPPTTEPLLQP